MSGSKLHRQTDTTFQKWTVRPETGQVACDSIVIQLHAPLLLQRVKGQRGGSFFSALYRSQYAYRTLEDFKRWMSDNVSHLKTIYQQVTKLLATD